MKPTILALVVLVASVYGFCYCIPLTVWWAIATQFLCTIAGIASFIACFVTTTKWAEKNL